MPKTNCERMNQGHSIFARIERIDDAERDEVDGGPEERHQERTPGERFGKFWQHRHEHAVYQAEDQRHDDVNGDAERQERWAKLLHLCRGQIADARHDHAC